MLHGLLNLHLLQFVDNCTLAGWNPGSTVIRAVSDTPNGPFTYAETVFGTFHHNPTVRRLSPAQSGDGSETFVMLMIGDNVPATGEKGAKCGAGTLDVHHLEGYIKMAWSKSLLGACGMCRLGITIGDETFTLRGSAGPWNYSHHTMVTPGSVDDWDAMVTNPAPLFLANGTAYLYYRGTMWPKDGYERIGVTKATTWKGPYGRPFGDHLPLWCSIPNLQHR